MSGGNIFGFTAFEAKRTLTLPRRGGEITLYVLDGEAYPVKVQGFGSLTHKVVETFHFGGWEARFRNNRFNTYLPHIISHKGLEHCGLEVVFRLVDDEFDQTAEIVAVIVRGVDNEEIFFDNDLCTLPAKHEE